MRSVGSHSTSGREKEEIKERMGWEIGKFSGGRFDDRKKQIELGGTATLA